MTTDRAWRFHVNNHDGNGEPTITRGKIYRLGSDGDQWRWYWEGDTMVAFTVHWRGYPEVNATSDSEDTERAIAAWKAIREFDMDEDASLKRLAFRLTGNWDADFICVSLDRSYDLYALSWDGDPDRTWADEIEALNCGEVYRMEVEEWDGEAWQPADDMCDEWYGEDKARDAHEKEFPLAWAPAEFHVTEVAS